MIAKNLNAPLHESEERAVDRAIMQEGLHQRPMTWQERAAEREKECERLRKRADVMEAEYIELRRAFDDLKSRVARYYKEIR